MSLSRYDGEEMSKKSVAEENWRPASDSRMQDMDNQTNRYLAATTAEHVPSKTVWNTDEVVR
jgi:hypothetical protein